MESNGELKAPHQEQYHHNGTHNISDNMPAMPSHDGGIHPPMPYGSEDGRMLQQPPFPFPPLLMPSQLDNSEAVPTDLRVMAPKNPCHCGTSEEIDEPQNLVYRRRNDDASDSESDTEIDLTSHSKDDDLRESERLANRIATNIFRSDTVLHDLLPNDLSMGVKGASDRNHRNNVM